MRIPPLGPLSVIMLDGYDRILTVEDVVEHTPVGNWPDSRLVTLHRMVPEALYQREDGTGATLGLLDDDNQWESVATEEWTVGKLRQICWQEDREEPTRKRKD